MQRQLEYPPELREMITLEELRGLQDDVHTVYADPALIGYAISLADATRNPASTGSRSWRRTSPTARARAGRSA